VREFGEISPELFIGNFPIVIRGTGEFLRHGFLPLGMTSTGTQHTFGGLGRLQCPFLPGMPNRYTISLSLGMAYMRCTPDPDASGKLDTSNYLAIAKHF
jgi:hypothetical protein